MKTTGAAVLVSTAITMLGGAGALAQEEAPERGTRVGIGVALASEGGIYGLYAPLVMTSGLRIEPEIGFSTVSESEPDYGYSYQRSSVRVGVGVLPATQRGKASIYYGLRIGFVYASTRQEYDVDVNDHSQIGYFVAGSVGAEYLVSSHFGVGAEAQLRYESLSGKEETGSPSRYVAGTRSLLLIRWYL